METASCFHANITSSNCKSIKILMASNYKLSKLSHQIKPKSRDICIQFTSGPGLREKEIEGSQSLMTV